MFQGAGLTLEAAFRDSGIEEENRLLQRSFPFCSAHWAGGEFWGVLPVCARAHAHSRSHAPHTGLRCWSLPKGEREGGRCSWARRAAGSPACQGQLAGPFLWVHSSQGMPLPFGPPRSSCCRPCSAAEGRGWAEEGSWPLLCPEGEHTWREVPGAPGRSLVVRVSPPPGPGSPGGGPKWSRIRSPGVTGCFLAAGPCPLPS